MARVKFTETVTTRETDPQRFEAGEVYDLPELSANRWVVRGKAERVSESARPGAAAAEPPPKPQPSGPPAKNAPAVKTARGDRKGPADGEAKGDDGTKADPETPEAK